MSLEFFTPTPRATLSLREPSHTRAGVGGLHDHKGLGADSEDGEAQGIMDDSQRGLMRVIKSSAVVRDEGEERAVVKLLINSHPLLT